MGMKTMQVQINDPEATVELQKLADKGMISIRYQTEHTIPRTDEIRKEVQLVMESIIYYRKRFKLNSASE